MDDCGLSRRQAVLVVNVILERMIKALKRGREVEFPFGKLKRVKRHFGEHWDAIDDHPANREPYTVEHEMNEAEDQELNPWAWLEEGGRRPRKARKELHSRPPSE